MTSTDGLSAVRVLHIEDRTDIQMAVRRFIQRSFTNSDIITVSSLKECRRVLRDNSRFDVIISDWEIEDCTGGIVFSEIRSKYPELVARYMFLCSPRVDVQVLCEEFGLPLLEKPCSPKVITEKIKKILDFRNQGMVPNSKMEEQCD